MDIVHYLGTHPKESRELHKLPPEAVPYRVHELLVQAKQRQQQESSSATSLPLEGISFKEFRRRRDAQEQAKRLRR
jgi:hypothetical protein